VQAKTWSVDLGASFSWRVRLRRTGDYGGSMHVSPDEAKEAVDKARSILQAVRTVSPESLPPITAVLGWAGCTPRPAVRRRPAPP
jgi:hypothetical protein